MFSSKVVKQVALTVAASIAVALTPALAAPAHAHDGTHDLIGGSIKRSEVIERAWTWVNRDVPYSQDGVADDAERHHTYRRDCSGFISMTWHIQPTGMSAPNTSALLNYTHSISKANLKRGDILLDAGNHVVLFQRWDNDAHTRFWLFEQSNPTTDMNHRVADLSSYSGYGARRYNQIIDG